MSRTSVAGIALVTGWLTAAVGAQAAVAAPPEEAAAAAVTASPFVAEIREATRGFRQVAAAEAAGYGLLHGCVSGAEGGAMGVHYANGALVGDGELDVAHPEVLMYEQREGRFRLLGVEYVVLAEAWHETNAAPPVLGGQLFSYTGSPNRYGIPAFYALHVWAWRSNPLGVFADWNPNVSCAGYDGGGATHGH